MIHRFGEEQILKPEEMVWIVKNRYLAKNEKCSEIESIVNIDKMKYIFGTALYTATEDGKIEMPNVIASYPFYPFQLAYMKDMLKNESKGSARNMMKTIKSIMKRPEVYNQEVGYFVGTDLIYEELKSKRSIEDEYSDLIASLESDPVLDDKQNPKESQMAKQVFLKEMVNGAGSMIAPLDIGEVYTVITKEDRMFPVKIETNVITGGGTYQITGRPSAEAKETIKNVYNYVKSNSGNMGIANIRGGTNIPNIGKYSIYYSC